MELISLVLIFSPVQHFIGVAKAKLRVVGDPSGKTDS